MDTLATDFDSVISLGQSLLGRIKSDFPVEGDPGGFPGKYLYFLYLNEVRDKASALLGLLDSTDFPESLFGARKKMRDAVVNIHKYATAKPTWADGPKPRKFEITKRSTDAERVDEDKLGRPLAAMYVTMLEGALEEIGSQQQLDDDEWVGPLAPAIWRKQAFGNMSDSAFRKMRNGTPPKIRTKVVTSKLIYVHRDSLQTGFKPK